MDRAGQRQVEVHCFCHPLGSAEPCLDACGGWGLGLTEQGWVVSGIGQTHLWGWWGGCGFG